MAKKRKSRAYWQSRLFSEEYIRMEDAGLLGKTVKHKATGKIGILKGQGQDYHERVEISLPELDKWGHNLYIPVTSEDEFEVVGP